MSTKVLESELRIVASDKTAAVFKGVLKHAVDMRKTLAGMEKLKISEADFAAASAAIKEQTRLLRGERQAAQELHRSLTASQAAIKHTGSLYQKFAKEAGFGSIAIGGGAVRIIKDAGAAAASFEHERALMGVAGMRPAEIAEAIKAAWAATAHVPGTDVSDAMKVTRELRMVFGNTEEAVRNLEPILRATATLKAVRPDMDASNESYALAKSLELKGASQDPEHFKKLMGMMIQTLIASGGKVTGSEFFEFTQMTRGASLNLSDRFYARVAPALIQEMHGAPAGTAISALETALGGKMGQRSAEEFVRLGLANNKDVIRTKTGSVKGIRPGSISHNSLRLSDPDLWIQNVLAPALASHGIVGEERVTSELQALFGNRFANYAAKLLLMQQQRIEKEITLQNSAAGPSAIDDLRTTDPGAAWHAMSAEFTNLLAVLAAPEVPIAIAAMNHMQDAFGGMIDAGQAFEKAYPPAAQAISELTTALGGLAGIKMLQGTAAAFGMEGIAAALGAAAAVALPVALAGVVLSVAVMNWPEISYYIKRAKEDIVDPIADSATGRSIFDWVAHNLPGSAAQLGGPVFGDDFGGHATIGLDIKVDGPAQVTSHVDNGIPAVRFLPPGTTGSLGRSMPGAGGTPLGW